MPADKLYVVLSTRAGDGLREVRQNRPFTRLGDARDYANRERGCDLHFVGTELVDGVGLWPLLLVLGVMFVAAMILVYVGVSAVAT